MSDAPMGILVASSFRCPACGKKLRVKDKTPGRRYQCPGCRQQIEIQSEVSASQEPSQSEDGHTFRSARTNPTVFFLIVGSMSSVVAFLLFALIAKSFAIGLAACLVVLSVTAICCLRLLLAVSKAIRDRRDEIDFFGGTIKLVLWEANQGLVFLKNKRVDELVYGPDDGGGTRFIFPVVGEELKVRVPLTLRLSVFEDNAVLTRESVQLYMKVALWWRIADLEKYYYSIDRQVRVVSDYDQKTGANSRTIKSSELSQHHAAEQWLLTLTESCIRRLISQSTTAFVVSKNATSYLHVEDKHLNLPDKEANLGDVKTNSARGGESQSAEHTAPETLANEIGSMLAPKIEEYGLEINRVEIQEVRLPQTIQKALDEVFKATLQPAQSAQEAKAEQIRLQAAADVLGVEAVAMREVIKNFRGSPYLGNFPKFMDALFTGTKKERGKSSSLDKVKKEST